MTTMMWHNGTELSHTNFVFCTHEFNNYVTN